MSSDVTTTPWWRSFRLRIATAVALVSLVMLLIVGIIVDYQSAIAGRERLRSVALERLAAALAISEQANGRMTQGISVISTGLPDPLTNAVRRSGQRATFFDGRDMWAAEAVDPANGLVVNVQVSGEPLIRERTDLRRSLLWAGLPAIATVALLGWLVASGLSRRLRRSVAALHDIGPDGRLPRPVDSGGRDEVGVLTRAVDQMAASLAERIEREKRFSADVAHELRTPMTALVSAAELLPEDDEVSALVRNQVGRLRRLVLDLLELFRTESGAEGVELAEIDLADGVRQSLAQVPWELPELEVRESALVVVEQRRLDRIVANLVGNAVAHGGRCTVSVAGAELTVADDGEGFPQELIDQGPRRFVRGSSAPGTGLGLSIARAQAELMGGTLVLANDGGAVARVRFDQPAKR